MILIVGVIATILCLGLQALAVVLCIRYLASRAGRAVPHGPRIALFRRYSLLMLLLMAGNVGQAMIWAALYRVLDALPDFETALYFSGVTFTSLGYGDVVLPPQVRLLAPLQAANGLMMFGITTAVFMSAAQYSINRHKNGSHEQH